MTKPLHEDTTRMGKKQGLYVVFAAIAIQLILGTAYIWSVFQTGIAESIFNGDHAAASLTFSLLLATLTIGAVIGGKLASKFSTRIVVLMGGFILSAGFFAASFVTSGNAWLLWITYGIMGGVGMGFTYSTTIACAQKWFPHKRGLVTGIIVAALGLGGVVFTPIVERLIHIFGGTGTIGQRGGEPSTFMVLSAVFLIVCTAGSFFMKSPHGAQKAALLPINDAKSFAPAQMLRTPQFYLVMFSLMLACMGGLMMMAFARPIAVDRGLAETATIGVLAVTMFNSLGRLVWGAVSDKLGRINTIMLLLAGNAALSLLVNAAQGYLIYVLIACIGFFYGGLLSNFPALTADIFGVKHQATNYGFVLLGFGVGAIISSQIAGHFKNASVVAQDINEMFPAFIIASVCAAAGILMMLILKELTKAKR